jgi:hypothetical protein
LQSGIGNRESGIGNRESGKAYLLVIPAKAGIQFLLVAFDRSTASQSKGLDFRLRRNVEFGRDIAARFAASLLACQ